MSIFVRPFAVELLKIRRPKVDEAAFIAVLLGLTLFHGFTMLSMWTTFAAGMEKSLYYAVFTFFLAVSVALPLGALYLISFAVKRVLGSGVGTLSVFKILAYILVPVALFYHLAHNSMHILMEGSAVVPLLSDPLGAGWNLLGTRGMEVKPLLSMKSVRTLQVAMVFLGLLMSMLVARRTIQGFEKEKRARIFMALVSLILAVILLSLWLLYQPMVMRVT